MNQVAQKEHNALWNAFSAEKDRIAYGSQHYQIRSEYTSTILKQLFAQYKQEGIDMPYTMENFIHDVALEHLSELTIDERLQGLPAEEIAQRLPLEERLKGLPAEELEAYLEKMRANKSDSSKK